MLFRHLGDDGLDCCSDSPVLEEGQRPDDYWSMGRAIMVLEQATEEACDCIIDRTYHAAAVRLDERQRSRDDDRPCSLSTSGLETSEVEPAATLAITVRTGDGTRPCQSIHRSRGQSVGLWTGVGRGQVP